MKNETFLHEEMIKKNRAIKFDCPITVILYEFYLYLSISIYFP